MRILGLDLETTGLDTANDRITELGYVLWDTDQQAPLLVIGEFFHDASYPKLSEDIQRLTGLSDNLLHEFGVAPSQGLRNLTAFCEKYKVEYIVAHNGENFDRPLLYAELTRAGLAAENFRAIPWIDTKTDLPFVSEPESRRLKHLALDAGFINPFPHRAVFDVLTMLRVLAQFDLQAVLDFQKIPFVTCRAMVSFDQKDLAKAERYSWEKIGEKTFPKWWVKRIKETLLPLEIEACKKRGFQTVRVE